MSDILRTTLARLADGRKIADDDIVKLCDRIAELEAALQEIVKRTRHAHPMSYVSDYYRIANAAANAALERKKNER